VSGEVELRRATLDDVGFLVELANDEDVAPFLAAVSARDAEAFRTEIEAAAAAPAERGRHVIEQDGRPAGAVAFELVNRRSRIDPRLRGRGLARAATRAFARHLFDELGVHRIELECYGFNERAIRHFEACGFVREGVKRKAYRRGDEWVDGVWLAALSEEIS
jgi:RimJ/RimL family protein N-acetyltransferase